MASEPDEPEDPPANLKSSVWEHFGFKVGSEMEISGKAVSLYFEEKLQEIFPGQSFPDTPETESMDAKLKEDEDTDDSGEDFIQPRRKRLKTDDKVVHIK